MYWKRAPAIVREIRIAIIIPEIRRHVLKTVAIRLAMYVVAVPTAAVMMPGAAIYLALKGVCMVLEIIGDAVRVPATALRYRVSVSVEAGHNLMPVEEIQRRAYGEGPKITGDMILDEIRATPHREGE